MRRRLRRAAGLLAPLVAALLRALAVTWRVRIEGEDPLASDPPGARLGALWHRGLLVAAGLYRDSGIHVPVSRSADGDLIVAVMERLGLGAPPRGSSRSGAVPLLRALVRLVQEGRLVAIPTDGPLGPARVSKAGVIQVARLAGTPLVPVAISARPCLRFGSWDRMLLPLPFARVVCRYGDPIEIAADVRGDGQEALRARLDARLDEMTDALDSELGLPPRAR
jgi:lysophospholipid acyltransferase (LPLAT)-like uncharacterized protein